MEYPFWVIYEPEDLDKEVLGEFATYKEASAFLSEQDTFRAKSCVIYVLQPLKRGATE